MKINKNKLIQIIKEELALIQEGQLQDDPEEAMMNLRAEERIKEIDAEIAQLQSEKDSLLMNIDSSGITYDQSIRRGPQ